VEPSATLPSHPLVPPSGTWEGAELDAQITAFEDRYPALRRMVNQRMEPTITAAMYACSQEINKAKAARNKQIAFTATVFNHNFAILAAQPPVTTAGGSNPISAKRGACARVNQDCDSPNLNQDLYADSVISSGQAVCRHCFSVDLNRAFDAMADRVAAVEEQLSKETASLFETFTLHQSDVCRGFDPRVASVDMPSAETFFEAMRVFHKLHETIPKEPVRIGKPGKASNVTKAVPEEVDSDQEQDSSSDEEEEEEDEEDEEDEEEDYEEDCESLVSSSDESSSDRAQTQRKRDRSIPSQRGEEDAWPEGGEEDGSGSPAPPLGREGPMGNELWNRALDLLLRDQAMSADSQTLLQHMRAQDMARVSEHVTQHLADDDVSGYIIQVIYNGHYASHIAERGLYRTYAEAKAVADAKNLPDAFVQYQVVALPGPAEDGEGQKRLKIDSLARQGESQ
jgi:hypothetical protein